MVFEHTIHAINKLVSDTQWALNDNKCVGACLIDLEKAFDTVARRSNFQIKNEKIVPNNDQTDLEYD